jgi:dephospho-CoA kinase
VRIIGLTGGIGSGKTTVSAILRDLGATVVDADEAARGALLKGAPGYDEVVASFGDVILDDGGRVDRQRLADIVFADDEARARLNAIVHPRVREWMAVALHEADTKGVEVAFMDVPLLYENGLDRGLEEVVVVWAPEETQVERAVSRGLREDDVRARMRAQMPLAEKRARATRVIDNSGPMEETRLQVRRLWEDLNRV